MAALMAGESMALPSPMAPNVRMSKRRGEAGPLGWALRLCAAARAGTAAAAEAAKPMLPSLMRSRRAELKEFMALAMLAEKVFGWK
jgi:hypothetical protein